jgi:hypothetical protein
MDLNHRCLGVGQESLPLDHGTKFGNCEGWNRTNIKTFRASRPAVRRPRIAATLGEMDSNHHLLLQRQAACR